MIAVDTNILVSAHREDSHFTILPSSAWSNSPRGRQVGHSLAVHP